MSFRNNIFNSKQVIESFKLKNLTRVVRGEWGKRKKKNLFDFLPELSKFDISDLQILESWKTYFTSKGVPWAITSIDNRFVLWKTDERPTPNQIDKIRMDPKQRWFVENDNAPYTKRKQN